ncbi:diguanylate cyclase [Catenovulum sp. SX2]|uniref:GGDEF domain-containing protein n=1 Tax=Catenovulum sp. SX2 TaxID=3398614 RepID=UPI003F84B62C
MQKSHFSWLTQSLTRKISSLSAVLLGFIFVVIVYSIVKLVEIGAELREVAEIDIPLTEVISEIEVLQLQQHIILEQIRLAHQLGADNSASASQALVQRQSGLKQKFQHNSTQINKELGKAAALIDQAIKQGQVIDKLADHQQAYQLILDLSDHRNEFSGALLDYIEHIETHQQLNIDNWLKVEADYEKLDQDVETLLIKIEQLTEEIARNTEQHEQEFMLVNIGLGISALIIGIHITWYIIGSFRRRVSDIQGQLSDVQSSLGHKHKLDKIASAVSGKDELSDLASSMYQVVDRFVDELNSQYQVEEKLIQLAVTDKLTGAYNRHKWLETLQNETELAKRGGSLSLIAIDLDYFKSINDNYGHSVGDDVLVASVNLVKQISRKTDSLFRLGGEEFMLLVRQQNIDETRQFAEKIRQTFEAFHSADLPKFTASFGVAEYKAHLSIEEFIDHADKALYQSKQEGRNKVSVY